MRVLLDTNRYEDYSRNDPAVLQRVQEARTIYLSFVTLAELRAGFACGTRGQRNESLLVEFLNSPRVRTLYPDEETTHLYARVYSQLRQQGTPIPTNDMWIAALVIQHGLFLCSRDRHFDHLPQLARVT